MQIDDQRRDRSLTHELRRRRYLRADLAQLIYIAVAVGLGLLIPKVDIGARIPSGEVATLLAGLAAGLLALIGIVFALLFLVLQFAATAQSPRLHLFRDNPLVWHALGLVVGIIVYSATCLMVAADDPTTTVLVPISMIVLVLVAIAITRRLQLDALRSIDLATAMSQVTTRTKGVIDRIYTKPFAPLASSPATAPPHALRIRWHGPQQYLRQIDLPRLVNLARQSNTTIGLTLMPGGLVRENSVVLEVWNADTPIDAGSLLRCLELGVDRTFTQDPLFGFRLLNDFALRAVSTAINDPATAVQAIDSIEFLLISLAGRDLEIGRIDDDTSTLRVVFHAPSWEAFLAAGADEIAETPMPPMVRRRLRTMLELVLVTAPIERRASVERRLVALAKTEGHLPETQAPPRI